MMFYICTKLRQIILTVWSYRADKITYTKQQRGIIPYKMYAKLWFLFSAHRLMMLYVCTKFHENIFDDIEQTQSLC